jgi:hypothetical protein
MGCTCAILTITCRIVASLCYQPDDIELVPESSTICTVCSHRTCRSHWGCLHQTYSRDCPPCMAAAAAAESEARPSRRRPKMTGSIAHQHLHMPYMSWPCLRRAPHCRQATQRLWKCSSWFPWPDPCSTPFRAGHTVRGQGCKYLETPKEAVCVCTGDIALNCIRINCKICVTQTSVCAANVLAHTCAVAKVVATADHVRTGAWRAACRLAAGGAFLSTSSTDAIYKR